MSQEILKKPDKKAGRKNATPSASSKAKNQQAPLRKKDSSESELNNLVDSFNKLPGHLKDQFFNRTNMQVLAHRQYFGKARVVNGRRVRDYNLVSPEVNNASNELINLLVKSLRHLDMITDSLRNSRMYFTPRVAKLLSETELHYDSEGKIVDSKILQPIIEALQDLEFTARATANEASFKSANQRIRDQRPYLADYADIKGEPDCLTTILEHEKGLIMAREKSRQKQEADEAKSEEKAPKQEAKATTEKADNKKAKA